MRIVRAETFLLDLPLPHPKSECLGPLTEKTTPHCAVVAYCGSSTFNRGEPQKLGFLPHLLYAALKLGSKPIEMGHLNMEKPSFLVDQSF